MVVAIIAILAAIAIPNLLQALNRSRQKRTLADIRTIAVAWESRATDLGRYNAAALAGVSEPVTIDNLEIALTPTYIKNLPLKDGWGRQWYLFTDKPWSDAEVAGKYAIVSPGRDGVYNSSQSLGVTTDYDCDVIYSNGTFLSYPEGAQTSE
jgi:general secretion pathway protein G